MHLSIVVMADIRCQSCRQQQRLKRIPTTTTQRALTTNQHLLEHPAKSSISVVQVCQVGWAIKQNNRQALQHR